MGLVQHDYRVLGQRGVDDALAQQNPVRHVLDARIGACHVLEPDRVAHIAPHMGAHFVRHTVCNTRCTHSPAHFMFRLISGHSPSLKSRNDKNDKQMKIKNRKQK